MVDPNIGCIAVLPRDMGTSLHVQQYAGLPYHSPRGARSRILCGKNEGENHPKIESVLPDIRISKISTMSRSNVDDAKAGLDLGIRYL